MKIPRRGLSCCCCCCDVALVDDDIVSFFPEAKALFLLFYSHERKLDMQQETLYSLGMIDYEKRTKNI